MKMNIKKIAMVGLFSLGFIACDIETVDQSALSPGQALNTAAGVQSAVLSTYRRTAEFDFYGQQANLHGDAFADNIEIVNRTGRYEQEWVNGIGVYANRWAVAYRGILDANYVLEYLPKLSLSTVPSSGSLTSQQVLDHMKGEALFLRALFYMELLRVYAYSPGKEVNGFNLGVIIRDKPTQVVSDADKKARSTNLECYQFVEQDLLDATTLLLNASQIGAAWPASLGTNTFPFRATRAAAHALLARHYLNWSRFADADTQATTALTLVPVAAPVSAANYATAWSTATHPESIFEIEIRPTDWSGVDGPNNSMNSVTTNMLSGSQYVLAGSAELMAAHEAGDVRRNVYLTTTGTLNKPQSRKWPGEKGAFVENIPVIRRSEMYLIQAESRARTGNDAGAQNAVNTIRTNRGLTATALTGTALIDLIMNERRVEFAMEGHRFYDFKRLGLDVPKPAASGVGTLPYTDFRMLQQIPNDQILLNSNLVQNPGY
ncbi:MAG: RagB/SusD family nutrient uptake outer membrane protein [Cyclobacteriaceae bacterium]|jgi:starch-binding outer membrane protein, SusD/RagB family|nr:RagB/SusD family nutrient uptake outer membrane protein [Cyclobacteriaceae bacterium]